MAEEEVGPKPTNRTFKFYRNSDFYFGIKRDDTFPVNSKVTLEVEGKTVHTYQAVISGGRASFELDYTDVNALITDGAKSYRLYYDDGSDYQIIIGIGKVRNG